MAPRPAKATEGLAGRSQGQQPKKERRKREGKAKRRERGRWIGGERSSSHTLIPVVLEQRGVPPAVMSPAVMSPAAMSSHTEQLSLLESAPRGLPSTVACGDSWSCSLVPSSLIFPHPLGKGALMAAGMSGDSQGAAELTSEPAGLSEQVPTRPWFCWGLLAKALR